MKNQLEARIIVEASIEQVCEVWTKAAYIKIWNVPFPGWHCPTVVNEVKTSGVFDFRMEKKDGSEGFNYKGKYTLVVPFERIEILQDDHRRSVILFKKKGDSVEVIEQFEPEEHTELTLQKDFCQAVLNKFKACVENNLK
ncbi:SRPBCC domain-containing protein [Sphingobacterium cellulitidis]|uniref:SRPBCC domain-containing protein n=1 Tax=Sphingobacterium cellulitidis TaxID=1768011 RepID=UPI000B944A3F|nr:hypothetical protein CHT99_12895 [Sphingobacterium cellulitidis]